MAVWDNYYQKIRQKCKNNTNKGYPDAAGYC